MASFITRWKSTLLFLLALDALCVGVVIAATDVMARKPNQVDCIEQQFRLMGMAVDIGDQ